MMRGREFAVKALRSPTPCMHERPRRFGWARGAWLRRCWFLAVDVDKSTWKEDVRAFAKTAPR